MPVTCLVITVEAYQELARCILFLSHRLLQVGIPCSLQPFGLRVDSVLHNNQNPAEVEVAKFQGALLPPTTVLLQLGLVQLAQDRKALNLPRFIFLLHFHRSFFCHREM